MKDPRLPWWRRSSAVISSMVLAVGLTLACSGGGDSDTGSAVQVDPSAGATAGDGEPGDTEGTPGVYKFGQAVKFDDGSTLTVGKPVKFNPDEYASGGDKMPMHLKFKCTLKNNTKKIYDPSLTSASASAGGEEGESVYQNGLDAPDNKVLPGKSVSWWMGYGVKTQKDLQLEVSLGFLDGYGTVIFTN